MKTAEVSAGVQRAWMLHERDNVATALAALKAGVTVDVATPSGARRETVRDAIPFGHKFSVDDIALGAAVVKYGEGIGVASQAIARGRHVHVHNVVSGRG